MTREDDFLQHLEAYPQVFGKLLGGDSKPEYCRGGTPAVKLVFGQRLSAQRV
ncbi:hypothetical protein AG1IA_02069 [Rhizoctonia solani AG-1 IA]|uniref:Uncharacterized protein n=1 Tax=Thanatephorus cucumeris (strain AG1-IA) TaxID=983506 RepID=L8X5K5_THACA|nr:hypothetical protein AG1IA_02069 [Rhizoctonia solani AG-1 IA]